MFILFFPAGQQAFFEQKGKIEPAKTQHPPSRIIPTPKRDSLLNGLQVIMVEQPANGAFLAILRINSGAMFDRVGKGGLSELTAAIVIGGEMNPAANSILDSLDQLGIRLSYKIGWDSVDITFRGPADSLDVALEMVGKLLINPSFDQKNLTALKTSRIAALKSKTPDDSEIVFRKGMEVIYGAHPYGHPVPGTIDSLSQINISDVISQYQRFYIANNSEIFIMGDVSAEVVMQSTRTRLGAWKKGEVVQATFRPPDLPANRQVFIIDRPNADKANTIVLQALASRRSSDFYSVNMMSRILDILNKKAALSTGGGSRITTSFSSRYIGGPLAIEATSQAEDIAGITDSILASFEALKSGQYSPDYLIDAKREVLAEFESKFKTDEGLAQSFLDIELYGLGRDYILIYPQWIEAITLDNISKAAQKYLKPLSVVIVITGPADKIKTQMKKFGTVNVIH